MTGVDGAQLEIDDYAHLMGFPSLREFVQFVKTRSIDDLGPGEAALVNAWNDASRQLHSDAPDNSNLAEMPELHDISRSTTEKAEEALQRAAAGSSYFCLPHRWMLISLDNLIVCQKAINLSFAAGIQSSLTPSASLETLAELAVGVGDRSPTVNVLSANANTHSFSSASRDLRVLGILPTNPKSAPFLTQFQVVGRVQVAICVLIGFGPNVMHAVRWRNRVVLMNGTHRAYAMRAAGITYAPLPVRQVHRVDELELLGAPQGEYGLDWHFGTHRPALLRDYFNPLLVKTMRVARTDMCLRLTCDFEQFHVPSAASLSRSRTLP